MLKGDRTDPHKDCAGLAEPFCRGHGHIPDDIIRIGEAQKRLSIAWVPALTVPKCDDGCDGWAQDSWLPLVMKFYGDPDFLRDPITGMHRLISAARDDHSLCEKCVETSGEMRSPRPVGRLKKILDVKPQATLTIATV